ncbi:SCO7613 C-terminal domain-containing membrane protein [Streptomyces sp. NPDC050658]|uniref:SCO7613 C-terminal domain-containing membrane protein n=1 Tax=unclassified Streptomyces TaxID=2593676 RepID=UPI00343A1048
MTNIPPPAEELRILDQELRHLDARRAQLLRRRAWLLGTLQAAQPPRHPQPPRTSEATPPNVQNALLTLGGILLTVAAVAFTVVSWGHLGIGGRSAVLAALTLTALAVPAVLLRRSLRSTAETVAALGLALTVLDAYALHAVTLPDADPVAYAAAASAVLAALWAAYGVVFRELRLPLPVAVAAAQLPLFLWASDSGDHSVAAALLVTAAFDTALALRAGDDAVRVVATVGACAAGLWGTLSSGWLSWAASDVPEAARAGALLALAAAVALVAAWLLPNPEQATGAAAAGALCLAAATGGVLREALPAAWTVPAYLACAVTLLAVVVRDTLPRPVRSGTAAAALLVHGLAVLWALPVLLTVLLGPARWTGEAWSGAPTDARAGATVSELPTPHPVMASLVLAVVAGVVYAGVRLVGTGAALPSEQGPGVSTEAEAPTPEAHTKPAAARVAVLALALSLAWAALLTLPFALQLPYAAGVSAHVAVTAALLVLATRVDSKAVARTALGLAFATSVSVAALALATTAATLGTLGALTALFLATAAYADRRDEAVPAVCAAVAYATALACAVGAAMDLRVDHTGLLVLAVPALAACAAAPLGRHRLTVPVEVAGAGAGGLGIVLAAGHATTLALALALGGVIAAGTAVRPDRRGVGYAAGVLFLLASWVRLAAWDVTTPEAYTLPATVPALLLGALRRRSDPATSSWTAYGPGLAATLLPSLAAAWSDPHWQRPLLLGIAALLITLAGARQRLQAPLVLGSAVLALDTLHELAPHVAQVVDALPRWLPPALAGLLLLAVGATYEQRLRDARKVRSALGRMR